MSNNATPRSQIPVRVFGAPAPQPAPSPPPFAGFGGNHRSRIPVRRASEDTFACYNQRLDAARATLDREEAIYRARNAHALRSSALLPRRPPQQLLNARHAYNAAKREYDNAIVLHRALHKHKFVNVLAELLNAGSQEDCGSE